MSRLMRCAYCGWLQDEPAGVKACARCGGELSFEEAPPLGSHNYLQAQMELDQITAPAQVAVKRHLILTLRTPAQPPAAEAAPTAAGRKPLGFVAVLDVSGSMRGEKLTQAKEAVRLASQRLREGDQMALVTFSSEVQTILKPTRVDASLRQRLEAALGDFNAGGQTALDGGLAAGLAAALEQPQDVNLVLLLSDGQANEGEIDLEKIGARTLAATRQGVIVSTLGVGADYNEALMAEIATQGKGRFYHIQQPHQIGPYVAGELGEASTLLARDVVWRLTLPPDTRVELFSSAYRVAEGAQVHLGDIPADTSLEVVLALTLPPQPAETRLKLEGRLAYRTPAGNTLEVALNPLTLRFAAAETFALRDGVVTPVVQRVLSQMQATGVLLASRTGHLSAPAPAQVQQVQRQSVEAVKAYAALLGEAAAAQLAAEHEQVLAHMQAAPAAAKTAVAGAHSLMRSAKKFDA